MSPLCPPEHDLAPVANHDRDDGLDVDLLEPARDNDPNRGSLVAQAAERAHAEVARRERDPVAELAEGVVRRSGIIEARPNEEHASSVPPSWAARRYAGGRTAFGSVTVAHTPSRTIGP
jgi:hypothetical protein